MANERSETGWTHQRVHEIGLRPGCHKARRDDPEALVQLKDEVKWKNGALEKYDAFYREVKAWSAEKARQREPHSVNNITLILTSITTVMSFCRLRLIQCYSLFIAYPRAPRV